MKKRKEVDPLAGVNQTNCGCFAANIYSRASAMALRLGPTLITDPRGFYGTMLFLFLLKQKKNDVNSFSVQFPHILTINITDRCCSVHLSTGGERDLPTKRLCLVFYLYRTEHIVRAESQTNSFLFPDSGTDSITQRILDLFFFYGLFGAFMDWSLKRETGKQIGKVRE